MTTVLVESGAVSLPMPLYLLVEDVGWWRGEDGSPRQQPFRNRFSRNHCLADYEVLAVMAKRLHTRIGLGMVLGEWDQADCLREVVGATWQGKNWTNRENRGPQLAMAAEFLKRHRDHLEVGLHGLCHEFWQDGHMIRSEFHDQDGLMRSPGVVRQHLDAFAAILAQHGFRKFPRFFVPPALCHSFGDGPRSMQAILGEYGIRYVITRFARARQYSPPHHQRLTWEEGVLLLERGEAPVSWEVAAAAVPGALTGPVLPLHWGNLLHPEPARNLEVAEGWVEAIEAAGATMETILARDVADCFRQAAVRYLGKMTAWRAGVEIDLTSLPPEPALTGAFRLKIEDDGARQWRCAGGTVTGCREEVEGRRVLEVLPEPLRRTIRVYPV